MKIHLALTLLSLFVISTKAGLLGGEEPVPENDPDYAEAKKMLLEELEKEAKSQPGSPKVSIKDVSAKEQVVNGIRYNFSFTAEYTPSSGSKTTKKCTSSLVKPAGKNTKLAFVEDDGSSEKISCK